MEHLAHLQFQVEAQSAERKKTQRKFRPFKPDRSREEFAPVLDKAVVKLTEAQKLLTSTQPGINPHLIFKLPIDAQAHPSGLVTLLEEEGINVVAVQKNHTLVVFEDDLTLGKFRAAIDSYKKGPKEGINKATQKAYVGTKFDVLEILDPSLIEPWSRKDRIGDSLQKILADLAVKDETQFFDLELWHPGSEPEARQISNEFKDILAKIDNNAKITDSFIGDGVILMRLRCRVKSLNSLLDLPIVALIDCPPTVEISPNGLADVTARNFQPVERPLENGPRLCIIDSGIATNHPLLAKNVGHAEAFLTSNSSAADGNGHGTMVGGIALFGNVQEGINRGKLVSPITLFSARILNEDNDFDDERLAANQILDAITLFKNAPYNCRVFNLSVSTNVSAFDSLSQFKQHHMAEVLDEIARKEKVLIVTATGNYHPKTHLTPEETLRGYPHWLFNDFARIAVPGTAAIAVTVGSIAESGAVSIASEMNREDLIKPIAKPNEISPFSRIGPGSNNSVKPDFIEYGGNFVFRGTGNTRTIGTNPGSMVISLHHKHTERLFSFNCGTSFATPKVSRLAALLDFELESQFGKAAHPNTLRALLALGSTIPPECHNQLLPDKAYKWLKMCGYGLPEENSTLYSKPSRVTLFQENSIKLDHFQVYGVPITPEFMLARGLRTIDVALAFDPPVRRTRLDYLGVEMSATLLRGMTLDEVFEACRKLEPNESLDAKIPAASNVKLRPPGSTHSQISPKKGTLQKSRFEIKSTPRQNYGDTYWLVIRAERKWAPSEIESQNYTIGVTLEARSEKLYQSVEQQLRVRAQAQEREKQRQRL